jgi:TonB family protein
VAVARTEPEPERTPVVLAAAAPTPVPAAPLAVAAQAVEPPPAPAEEQEVPLKLLVKVDPALPRQMQQNGFRHGFAQVQFTVAPDGSVSRAQTLKASHSRLGTAAVEAVRQWRFAPIPKARDAAVEVAFNSGEE